MRKTFAPFGEEVTVCSIDLRVGGDYRYVFVTDDGVECSFRGTFLEVEPPTRTVETWLFDGWPDAEAVESMELHETDGVTTLTWRLAFRDQAGRDHMTKYDGIEANFDNGKIRGSDRGEGRARQPPQGRCLPAADGHQPACRSRRSRPSQTGPSVARDCQMGASSAAASAAAEGYSFAS